MDPEQISKKELLDLTGISYGQLYRWKRKGLIPEDWFIRKSTFTGQETFFPKDEILARVEKIKDMKEDLSLDDIAGKFSPAPSEISMSYDEVISHGIAPKRTLDLYTEHRQTETNFSFHDIFALYVMNKLLQSGDLNMEEAEHAVKVFQGSYPKFEGRACELIVVRKLGVAVCLIIPATAPVYFDEHAKVIVRMNLMTCLEEIRMLM
jgi:hypothetical protein